MTAANEGVMQHHHVQPIAFVDAARALRDWAERNDINCPEVSIEQSEVEDDETWLLHDGDDKLIARVGYKTDGTIGVL